MVESLAQLRERCQKPNYRTVGNWMARYITRDSALYVTWLVLHTRLRADSIALISLGFGFLSALFVAIPTEPTLLLGALFLQGWYLLDHVDGQVARYYDEADLTGTFLDFMIHFFVHTTITFSLGLRMFLYDGSAWWIIAGFVAALSMGGISQFNDSKYKAFFSQLQRWRGSLLHLKPAEMAKDVTLPPWPQRILKSGFVFLYKLTEIHVFMNVLTLAAFLELGGWPAMKVFTPLYLLLLPFVLITRMVYTVRRHVIDKDFRAIFSQEGSR